MTSIMTCTGSQGPLRMVLCSVSCSLVTILKFLTIFPIKESPVEHRSLCQSLEPQITQNTASYPPPWDRFLDTYFSDPWCPKPYLASQAHSPQMVSGSHLWGEKEERPNFCCHPPLPGWGLDISTCTVRIGGSHLAPRLTFYNMSRQLNKG